MGLSNHFALVEVLKQLNRAEAEETGGDGLELGELLYLLQRGSVPTASPEAIDRTLATLVENRMAAALDDPRYAWDRGRIVGRRYAITVEGKAFLAGQLERSGRIG